VRKVSLALSIGASLAVIAAAAPARADTSAWVFVGGGVLGWKSNAPAAGSTATTFTSLAPSATMTIDAGVGTSPDARFIGGGLFRVQPIFGSGADLALLARLCSHGFQAGDWGFAIDAGGFARPWGVQSIGFSGDVSLGMPLGFTLTAQTEVGTAGVLAFGVVAGLDLLRLTIYRQTLLKWWQNPSPAYEPKKAAFSPIFSHF
jgi:hypothetical protein